MALPRTPRRHVRAALIGCALLAGGLLSTGSASAAGTPHIVILDPDSNLGEQVRDEQRRGNDVGTVIRTVGKGFVADLDRADVARLAADPRVLHVEPDGPVRLMQGAPTAQAAGNDPFAGAEVIAGATGTVTGTTAGASREAGEPSHGGGTGRASIWYQWTAPASGSLRLSTKGSSFDTLLAGYSGGSITALTQLAANDDDDGNLWSRVTVPVTEGTTYRIAVDGWGGSSGAAVLSWAVDAPAAEPTPAPSPAPTPAPSPGPLSRSAASWGLDRVDQAALPLNGTINTPQNGSGVTAYVIDTGVRPDHADFGGRVAAGFSSISDGNGSNDCNGHGTHVAGTVAGSAHGVAPAAMIVPVRVLSCSGSGSTSGVIAGIDWAVRHHEAGTPAVANLSLGGGYSSALNAAVAAGVADGITFAVAAGNSNADACNASPASEPSALTVGATTSSDARSSFSNWGSCLDVFAPGTGIRSAHHTSPTATETLSGTSMAAPHVAGAAALLLAATPSATPDAVRTAMVQGATRGVVSDPRSAANLLLNVSSGVAPAPGDAPARETTPARAPTPVASPERAGGDGAAGALPRTDGVSRPSRPRLIAARRTASGVTLRISGRGAAYRVVINGRVVARTASRTPTIRTKAARPGARVRVQVVGAAGVSPLSNIIRL